MHPLNTTYYLGLDLGQAHDPSALALVEYADLLQGRDPITFAFRTAPRLGLRHLRRWPLGTPYTDVVADVARAVVRLQPHPVHLVVDATGVGAPVVDLLRYQNNAATRTGAHLVPVVITGAPHAHEGKLATHTPKHELIRCLQLLLEKKGLTLAAGLPLADDLRRELAAFELKPSRRGTRSGAAHGEHDDLVMALALAVWRSQQGPRLTTRGMMPQPQGRLL